MDAGVAVVVVAEKNLEDLGKDAAANVEGNLVAAKKSKVVDVEEREEEEDARDGDANFISNYLYNGY